MIHCRVSFRKNTSKRLFYSTSTSPSSAERSMASLSPGERTTASTNNLSQRNINRVSKLKRPLSSVAVYHHYDDEPFDNVNVNVELDELLSNINRNNAMTRDAAATSPQHQQTQTDLYRDLNPNTMSNSTGSCCYTIENKPRFPCGSNYHEDEVNDLPPPLEEPKY